MEDVGTRLSEALAAARGEPTDDTTAVVIQQLWRAGAARYPEHEPPVAAFAALVAARHAESGSPPAAEHAADLYLVAGCLAEDPRALATLEAEYFAQIPAAIGHLRLPQTEVDEVVQRVRAKLLLRQDDADAALGRYAGRGNLGRLIRVSAVRVALNRLRDAAAHPATPKPRDADTELVRLSDAADDPELSFLKQSHRDQFKAAFVEGLATLAPKQRTMLRLSLVDGLSIDEIAAAHDVHRSTAARWLQSARDQVGRATRLNLRATMKLDAKAMTQVLALVRSRLELSLSRVLATDATPDA